MHHGRDKPEKGGRHRVFAAGSYSVRFRAASLFCSEAWLIPINGVQFTSGFHAINPNSKPLGKFSSPTSYMSSQAGGLQPLSMQQSEVRANQGSLTRAFAVAFLLLASCPCSPYTANTTPHQHWLRCCRIPAMVDHSTDKPVRVFESGSILMHPVYEEFSFTWLQGVGAAVRCRLAHRIIV